MKLSSINTRYVINKTNKKGFEQFSQKQYALAFRTFAHVLSLDPTNKEAKIGLLLSDSALDFPEHASHLFDYYQILLNKTTKSKAIAQILEILESMDKATFFLSSVFKSADTKKAEELDGILYQDFLKAVKSRSSFKTAFEDLMFSTRIIFVSKQEFYSFLQQLIENGFLDIGLEYIEHLREVYYDYELDEILSKALKNDHKKKHKLS